MHHSNYIYRPYKCLCNDYRKVGCSQMATPLLVLPLQLREAQPCVVVQSNTDVFLEVLFTKALTKTLSINALEGSSGHVHDWLTVHIDRKPVFSSSQKKNHTHTTISLCLNLRMESRLFLIGFKAVHRKEFDIFKKIGFTIEISQ